MNHKIIFLLLMVSFFGNADVIPFSKPNFTIYFDPTIASNNNLELFLCRSSDCVDNEPFEQYGPQYYHCSNTTMSCFVQAYTFTKFMKLRLTYQNKVYESTPFVTGSTLELGLKNDKLIVSEKSWLWKLFK